MPCVNASYLFSCMVLKGKTRSAETTDIRYGSLDSHANTKVTELEGVLGPVELLRRKYCVKERCSCVSIGFDQILTHLYYLKCKIRKQTVQSNSKKGNYFSSYFFYKKSARDIGV